MVGEYPVTHSAFMASGFVCARANLCPINRLYAFTCSHCVAFASVLIHVFYRMGPHVNFPFVLFLKHLVAHVTSVASVPHMTDLVGQDVFLYVLVVRNCDETDGAAHGRHCVML